MSDPERRYRWLLHTYPAVYHQTRGAEIAGAYLDLAGPDRRWQSPADVADVLAGGARERLQAAGATDNESAPDVPGLYRDERVHWANHRQDRHGSVKA